MKVTPRAWEEISPAVKAFIFAVPLVLFGLTGVSLKRKALLWPSSFQKRSNVPVQQDPFASSWLLPPGLFALVRLCFALWTLYVWHWMFANPPEAAGFKIPFQVHAFFTIWNYAIVTLYFLLSAAYSAARVCVPSSGAGSALWNGWRAVVWSLYQQQLPASFLVTFVFWAAVYPNLPASQHAFFRNLSSLNQHLFNFLMMACDGALNLMPVHLAHAVFMLFVASVYLYYGVWAHGCVPSMSFLDLARNDVALALVGVLLFNFLSYFLAWWANNNKFALIPKHLHTTHHTLASATDNSTSDATVCTAAAPPSATETTCSGRDKGGGSHSSRGSGGGAVSRLRQPLLSGGAQGA